MPYDEQLAGRIRQLLQGKRGVTERLMFGGLCFLFRGNMCVGVEGDRLMVRVDPAQYEHALSQPHACPMDFTGRPLRGFVFVSSQGYRTAASLKAWVARAVDFAASLPSKQA